jgi:hypothetical protein
MPMLTKLSLAATASLLLSAQAVGQSPTATPQKFNAVLCKTQGEAIAIASSIASGKTEPVAINLVNKVAGSEVCGRYIGYALVEIEKTANHGGGLFMLAGFASPRTACWPGRQAGLRLSTVLRFRAERSRRNAAPA